MHSLQLLRQLPARSRKRNLDIFREREIVIATVLFFPLAVHAASDQVETGRVVFIEARLIEHHEAIRIRKRQRLEQDTTHCCEQGDVGANAERHHQHGNGGKTGSVTKGAQTYAQIACERFKPVPRPYGESLLTNKSWIAKSTQGGVPGLFLRNSTFALLLFL